MRRALLLGVLVVAGCGSGATTAGPFGKASPTPSPSVAWSATIVISPGGVDASGLTFLSPSPTRSSSSSPPTPAGPSPVIAFAHSDSTRMDLRLSDGSTLFATTDPPMGDPVVVAGGNAVLLPVGQGATSEVYAVYGVFAGQVVSIPAPDGEPGAGQPWRLPVGAGAVTASGVRCTGAVLEVLGKDGDSVTDHAYVITGGVATPAPTEPTPPSADQVGSLDCG